MGKMAVCMGERFLIALLLAGACLAALALAASQSEAAGNTYYASPTGGAGSCSQAVPCSIKAAVVKADAGDNVSLAAGTYELPPGGLLLEKSIDFGASPAGPAVLETDKLATLKVTAKADATIHDLRLEGDGGLLLASGVAERVFVAYQGVSADACKLEEGATMRNSVCWTLETTKEIGVSHAIDITSIESLGEPVVLRNVTAIADNAEGNAIHLLGSSNAELSVNAANVIARSVNGTDVVAEIGGGGLPVATLTITNSSFGEVQDLSPNPRASVTPLGTAGNISAAPTLVDVANGDFHVGGDSPTLDGGIADISVGTVDLEGNDRSRPKCFGASPVPDMGAYERIPTANCPPPPPLPPPPLELRKRVFRVVSIFLNKKNGTGRLRVEVPGAGTLSLTGSGVKLVRRTAPAGDGVISLPIQTWAITKVRLAKRGKTRVRLKVAFDAKGGGVQEWSRGVLLRKRIS